jgi:hypothetical protein
MHSVKTLDRWFSNFSVREVNERHGAIGNSIKLHFLCCVKTSNTIAREKRAKSQSVSYAGLHSLERVTSLVHSDQ